MACDFIFLCELHKKSNDRWLQMYRVQMILHSNINAVNQAALWNGKCKGNLLGMQVKYRESTGKVQRSTGKRALHIVFTGWEYTRVFHNTAGWGCYLLQDQIMFLCNKTFGHNIAPCASTHVQVCMGIIAMRVSWKQLSEIPLFWALQSNSYLYTKLYFL